MTSVKDPNPVQSIFEQKLSAIQPRVIDLLRRPTPNRIANVLLAAEITQMFNDYATACRASFLKADQLMPSKAISDQRAAHGSIVERCKFAIEFCIREAFQEGFESHAQTLKGIFTRHQLFVPSPDKVNALIAAAKQLAVLSDHLRTALQTLRVVFQQLSAEVPLLSIEKVALSALVQTKNRNKTAWTQGFDQVTTLFHWFLVEVLFFGLDASQENLILVRKILEMCHMLGFGASTVGSASPTQCLSLSATIVGSAVDVELQKLLKTKIIDVVAEDVTKWAKHMSGLEAAKSTATLLDLADKGLGVLLAVLEGPLYEVVGRVIGEGGQGYGTFKANTRLTFQEKLISANLNMIIKDQKTGVAAACAAYNGQLMRQLIAALDWKKEALDNIVSAITDQFKSEVSVAFQLGNDNHVDSVTTAACPSPSTPKSDLVSEIIALWAKYVKFMDASTAHNITARFALYGQLHDELAKGLRHYRSLPAGTKSPFESLVAKEIDRLLKARTGGSSGSPASGAGGASADSAEIKQVAELVSLFTADPSPFLSAYKSFLARRLLLLPRFSRSGETLALSEITSRLGGDIKAAIAVFPLKIMLKEAEQRVCNALIWPEPPISMTSEPPAGTLPEAVNIGVEAFKAKRCVSIAYKGKEKMSTPVSSVTLVPDLGQSTCEVEIKYPVPSSNPTATGVCVVFGPLPQILVLMQLKANTPTTPSSIAAATGLLVPNVVTILGSIGIIRKVDATEAEGAEEAGGYVLDVATLARTRKVVWPFISIKV